MQAKIKATGEVFNIASYATVTLDNHDSFGNSLEKKFEEVEIIQEKSSDIDWEQRRYELAKAAMNGFVSSGWIDKMEFNTREVCVYAHTYYDMAERSLAIADEMIKQLKEAQK